MRLHPEKSDPIYLQRQMHLHTKLLFLVTFLNLTLIYGNSSTHNCGCVVDGGYAMATI